MHLGVHPATELVKSDDIIIRICPEWNESGRVFIKPDISDVGISI
jgi:hypothetical protein